VDTLQLNYLWEENSATGFPDYLTTSMYAVVVVVLSMENFKIALLCYLPVLHILQDSTFSLSRILKFSSNAVSIVSA